MAFHPQTAAEVRSLLGFTVSDVIALKGLAGSGTSGNGTVSTYSGPNALNLNSNGNATTPHQDAWMSSALVSLDVRVKLSTDTLKVTGNGARLVSCWDNALGGWIFFIQADGNLGLVYANAAGNGIIGPYTGLGIAVSATTDTWVRMTYIFSGTGSGVMVIYSSTNGVDYVQAGDPQTVAAGSGQLRMSTAALGPVKNQQNWFDARDSRGDHGAIV